MPQSASKLFTDGKQSGDATAGSSSGSHLIPRTLFNNLLMEMRKVLVLRQLVSRVIGPGSIGGSSIDIPIRKKDSMEVHQVNEGASIPLDVEQYDSFNLKPTKYGIRIMISREMQEDSMFDVMAMNMDTAGYELADNEESLIIAALDTGTGQSDSTQIANSNATLPISDITAAMRGIEEENYVPTDMVIGVEIADDLRNIDTFTEADKAGINDPSKRLIGRIFAMNVFVSNNVNALRAFLVDRRWALIAAEKRPVMMEQYREWSRDTDFAVATQRIVFRHLFSGAMARIITI